MATAPVTIEKNKKLNSSPRRKNPPKLATNQSTPGATFPGQFVTNRPPPTSPPGDRLETIRSKKKSEQPAKPSLDQLKLDLDLSSDEDLEEAEISQGDIEKDKEDDTM